MLQFNFQLQHLIFLSPPRVKWTPDPLLPPQLENARWNTTRTSTNHSACPVCSLACSVPCHSQPCFVEPLSTTTSIKLAGAFPPTATAVHGSLAGTFFSPTVPFPRATLLQVQTLALYSLMPKPSPVHFSSTSSFSKYTDES